jgi:ribosome maturation factor RimP
LIKKIEENIGPIVRDLGYSIVKISFIGAEKTKTLQIMVERLDGSPITISDCEVVSRSVSVCLDVLDPVCGRYNLEVSSPGINRPLEKPNDFMRFVGNHVIIKTFELKNGMKTFRGLLDSATEHGIKVHLSIPAIEDVDFEYNEIRSACIDGIKQGVFQKGESKNKS